MIAARDAHPRSPRPLKPPRPRGHSPRVVGVVALGFQAVLLWLLSRGTFFYSDDFANFRFAQLEGFSPAALATPVFEHFAPAHRLVNGVVQAVVPLQGDVAKALLILVALACTWLLHDVLARAYGDGTWTWVVPAVVGVSPVVAALVRWWSAGLHYLPAVACILLCVRALLIYQVRPQAGTALSGLLAYVVGVLFYTKALLVPLWLVAAFLVVGLPAPAPARRGRSWATWWPWMLYAAPPAAYAALYRPRRYEPEASVPVGQVVEYLFRSWTQFFVPTVAGWPASAADATGWELAVAAVLQAAVVAAVVWTVRRRRTAWRAWTAFAAVFVVSALVVGLPRLAMFGPELGMELRYYTETLYVGAFLLPATVLPHRGEPGHGMLYQTRWGLRQQAGVALSAVVVGLSLVHGFQARQTFAGVAAADWVRTAQAEIASAARPVLLRDGLVPPAVMPEWWELQDRMPDVENRLSDVVPLFAPEVSFSPDAALTLSPEGTLVPVSGCC